MSRTRQTTDIVSTTVRGPFSWSSYNSSGTLTGSGTVAVQSSLAVNSGQTVITDNPGASNKTKTVTHTKRKYVRSVISSYDESSHNTTTDAVINRYIYNGPDAHGHSWGVYGQLTTDNISVSWSKTIQELQLQAMKNFSSANTVNTLLNAIESPQLVQGVRSFLSLLKPRARGVKASDAANIYLGYSFGVAPLISDIKKINKSLKTLKSDMDRYIRDYDKPQTAVARCGGTLSLNATGLPVSYGSYVIPPANESYWHVGTISSLVLPMRIVGVRGKRNVEYNTDAFKKLQYIIDRFVTTGPASFLWERVPYSFVVDWLVDLSSILAALDNVLTGSNQVYSDGWVSEKWSVLAPVIKHRSKTWTSDSDGRQTALNELSYYHREWLDPRINVGLSHRFGNKQASLTAALVYQLVANLKIGKKLKF
jgi:hypothetical protein